MRISSRLILNATATNIRLGISFVISLFMAWYTIGEAGLVGFGAIVMTAGTFGFSNVLIQAIRQSIIRDLAAALSSQHASDGSRLEQTMTAAMAFALVCAAIVFVLYAVLTMLSVLGIFRTDGIDAMPGALAFLFATSGVIGVATMLLLPYHVALVAAQHIPADGALMVANRIVPPLAAILTFEVFTPEATLANQLYVFALVRMVLSVFSLGLRLGVTIVKVPGLRWRLSAFDRTTFRELSRSTWQTAQFLLGTNLTLQALMLLVNLVFGLTYNGIWQILIVVSSQAKMLGDSLLYGLEALAASLNEQKRQESLVELATRTVRYQSIVIFCFVTCFLFFLEPIITLWVGQRIAMDEHLVAAGITAEEAMRLVCALCTVGLLAEIPRATSRGLERVMYGMGLVSTYAWFAKWSFAITIIGSLMLMIFYQSLLSAMYIIVIMQLLYFSVIIPLEARRHAGLSIRLLMKQAWGRPLLTVAAVALPVFALQQLYAVETVLDLVLVVIVCSVLVLLATFGIGFNQEERVRVLQLASDGIRRFSRTPASTKS